MYMFIAYYLHLYCTDTSFLFEIKNKQNVLARYREIQGQYFCHNTNLYT